MATRANRMRESARMTIEEWDGELDRALSYPDGARRALKRFPMIGLPGADKILLLTRTHPVLALDSNGLRVLLRVGYGTEGRSYATTYRSVREAIASEVPNDYAWLTRAHGILRQHGQGDCKRNWPACPECPIRDRCSFVSAPGR